MTHWATKDPAITPGAEIIGALEASLETVSDVFVGTKRAPRAMADRVSPIGNRRETAARLTTRNALSSDTYLEDLIFYESKALSTMGYVSDFKWFLPQLFRAHIDALQGSGWYRIGYGNHVDVFNKLERAEFANWPEHERDAVAQFIDCFWRAILHTYACEYMPRQFADNVTQVLGTSRLLDPWQRATGDAAILHLAQSRVDCIWGRIMRGAPDSLDEYDSWLLSDEAIEQILNHDPKPGPIADRYDDLVSRL